MNGAIAPLLCLTVEQISSHDLTLEVSDERPTTQRMHKHAGMTAGDRSLNDLFGLYDFGFPNAPLRICRNSRYSSSENQRFGKI